MKKLVAVPVVAIIAAAGAASAAGFAGGVSAGPLQTGQTSDLECATSAEVVEWGFGDRRAHPVRGQRPRQALGRASAPTRPSTSSSSAPTAASSGPRASGRIPQQNAGTQYVRVPFNGKVDAEQLKSIRISIDPGFSGQEYGTIG